MLQRNTMKTPAPTAEQRPTPLNEMQMFWQAVAMLGRDEKVSAAVLQRKYYIGYVKARRILDALEVGGYIEPQATESGTAARQPSASVNSHAALERRNAELAEALEAASKIIAEMISPCSDTSDEEFSQQGYGDGFVACEISIRDVKAARSLLRATAALAGAKEAK